MSVTGSMLGCNVQDTHKQHLYSSWLLTKITSIRLIVYLQRELVHHKQYMRWHESERNDCQAEQRMDIP